MKKISILLLVATATAYAADSALVLSDEIIKLGDGIVANALEIAHNTATEPLTGSVYECYLHLYEDGYKSVIAEHSASVAKAQEYLAALSDKENEFEIVKHAIYAFEAASSLPKSVEQAERVAAWTDELKLFVAALMAVAKKDFPEDLVMHPVAAQLILLNNGKVFADAPTAAFEGALLATLGGYEKRKQAMHDEQLFQAVRAVVYPASAQ